MSSNANWRSWVIPASVSAWASRHSGQQTIFDDSFGSWTEAERASGGYNHQKILDQVTSATTEVLAGNACFERDGITFPLPDFRWPLIAGLLSVAAREGSIRVLDFGGSLGSTFWQHRSLLHGIDTTWAVVEQPEFVLAGQQLDQSEVRFFNTIQSATAEMSPNVVLLSSVLQYLPDPDSVLNELLRTQASTIILDRTPMSEAVENIPCIQQVPKNIYSASYPAWVFSRQWLQHQLADWEIVAEFPGIELPSVTKHGVAFSWDGLIARRVPHD